MFNVYISYAEADRPMYEALFTQLHVMGATIWSFNIKDTPEINNEARYCISECTLFLLLSPQGMPLSDLMQQELAHAQRAQTSSGGSLNIVLGATSLTDVGDDFVTGWYVVPSERQLGEVAEDAVQRLVQMVDITHQSEESLKTMTKEESLLYLHTLYIHDQYQEMIQPSIMLLHNAPMFVAGWVLYSKALLALDRHQHVVEAMHSALAAVHQHDGLLFIMLANGYTCTRHYHEALAANEQAFSRAPENALVHLQRAHILLHVRQPHEAEKALERTRRLAPYMIQTELVYADLLCRYGHRYDEALAAVQRVLGVDPKNISALLAQTMIYTLKGQYHLAEHPLHIALASAPRDAHVLHMAGRVAEKQRLYVRASEYYKKAYALAPSKHTKRPLTRVQRLESGTFTKILILAIIFLGFGSMLNGMFFIDPLVGLVFAFTPFLALVVFVKSVVFLQNRLSRSL